MESPPPDALLLRPMTQEDLADMAELARSQGRNVGADEYERFLALEGARGFVITRNGVLIGAATAMRYFEHGFLGPVLLREDADATGVAIALLAQLVEAIQRDGCHVIDAEAAGTEEIILGRMGFQQVRRTLIMERPPGDAPAPPSDSVPMTDRHLLDVGALDAEVAGYGRKEYLMALRRDLPEGARVVEREGDLVGFVLLRRSPRGFHLGPLVTRARDDDAARALLRDAVAASAGSPVVALVPEGEPLLALLEGEGFREVGALSRMRAGSVEAPGDAGAATEWAIGGRITG